MKIEKLKRTLYFSGSVDYTSATNLIKDIQIIENSDQETKETLKSEYGVDYTPDPIIININSQGGSAYSALGVYDIIRLCKTKVHTKNIGLSASAAMIIYLAGSERATTERARFLIHQASSLAIGELKDLEERVEEIKITNDLFFLL